MPELPEVDAIAGVVRKHAIGARLRSVEVVRQNGKYFRDGLPSGGRAVTRVERIGKYIAIAFDDGPSVILHNAMTGYLDWEHDPWTFDYVEADREAGDSDVRVRFLFEDGKVLRFHDTRLFGFMFQSDLGAPVDGPELMETPNMAAGLRVISMVGFWRGLQVSTPVKVRLMEQEFLAGIGNIYSSEACHVAGIDPRRPANSLLPEEVSVLHASLVWVVDHCIPQVRYDWLNVYRRTSCGTCTKPITRVKLGGRATFFCKECQL